MRSLRQDGSVLQHRVKKGTTRRMMTFAVPYKRILAVFVPVVVLDAAISAVNPLILRALIDNGIQRHRADLVITPQVEASSFDTKAGRVRDIGVLQATYARIFFVALTALATAIVYGFGGVAAVRGTLAVGTVVALTQYLTRLYGPLTQLSNLQLDVMTALVSFERLFEVLDIVPMIAEDPDAVDIPRGAVSIELDQVEFTYPSAEEVSLASLESVAALETGLRNEVLHDVSFRVKPVQMVALVGPSGAGKTIISSLIPRLYDVTGGSLKLNGVDVRHATMQSIRNVVGVVTQDPYMFHDTLRAI